jgi:hypothetical protein
VPAVVLLVLTAACAGDDGDTAADTTTTATPETTTTTEPALEEGTQLEPLYFVPTVGDCFDRRKVPGAENKQVDVILALDCQLLHQYEIFATIDYPLPEDGDTTWPGDELVRNHARGSCPAYFEEYVGAPYETSAFEIGHLLPPEKNFLANQTIGCYVYDPTHERTAGSARGAAR